MATHDANVGNLASDAHYLQRNRMALLHPDNSFLWA